MTIKIRDVRDNEFDAVLALNNAAGPTILPLDMTRLRALTEQATYLRVA